MDTGTIFITLAADQNIFKLQLYNEYVSVSRLWWNEEHTKKEMNSNSF